MCNVIYPELGFKLENTTLEMLGQAKKIKVGKDTPTFIRGGVAYIRALAFLASLNLPSEQQSVVNIFKEALETAQ